MEASRTLYRLGEWCLAACLAGGLAACATERSTEVSQLTSQPARVEACGVGVGTDPYPDSVGIFLCYQMTASYCFDPANTDQDQDGLADYCEKQLSLAFLPELRYSTYYDDIRGEPYWVARRDSTGHVLIGYLFSYYRDLGSYQYSCTPPLKLADSWGCHNGDSESIWLLLGYDATTSHWVLQKAYYSAHDGWNVSSVDATHGDAAIEYPVPPGGGYPRVWIAEKKHANYFSQGSCNYGNMQFGLAWDWCGDDNSSTRLAWNNSWNIGSESHPWVNGVVSRDPTYEYNGRGRVECYWTERSFRGWVPDDIGGGQASSYLSKLLHFGFAATGVASCAPPPPPPPPAPLSVTITPSPPYYAANAAGGAAPYAYLWQACALDCYRGGDAAPSARGTTPNTVVHGWQVVGTSAQLWWDYGQWTLRVTVTDSEGAQAQAQVLAAAP